MQIVSWHQILTEHQSHTLRALQDHIGSPIKFVIGERNSSVRQGQGWRPPDTSDLQLNIFPSSGWWKYGKNIIDSNQESIHIFNGLWVDKRLFILLLYAQYKSIKTALFTESYSDVNTGYFNSESRLIGRVKVALRPVIYRLAGFLTSRKMGLVFVASEKAVEQFSCAGFKRDLIVPFGYFVPKTNCTEKKKHEKGKISVIFVGSIIERKGVDIAIAAVKKCRADGIDITLDLYGVVEDENIIKEMCSGVSYKGVIPFGETQCVMSRYDVSVLPSRYDGWGVVVNESVLQGVPVIVSKQVGARILVEAIGAGSVFEDGNINSLSEQFSKIAEDESIMDEWKENSEKHSLLLSPNMAAKHMYDCLNYIFYNSNARPNNYWNISK